MKTTLTALALALGLAACSGCRSAGYVHPGPPTESQAVAKTEDTPPIAKQEERPKQVEARPSCDFFAGDGCKPCKVVLVYQSPTGKFEDVEFEEHTYNGAGACDVSVVIWKTLSFAKPHPKDEKKSN